MIQNRKRYACATRNVWSFRVYMILLGDLGDNNLLY